MNICQTLWTAEKDLLNDDFGWQTPQHHLMGWALSSLYLNKFYKSLSLYTDEQGSDFLINKIGLPYNNVFNDYNGLEYNSQLWAIPKLLTYRKQETAFLHIDGDVIIRMPFSKKLLSAPLIVQNLENGTNYYRNLFAPIVNQLKSIPEILKQNLFSYDMKSYNAGIIGGNDIDFYKKYTAEAFKFIAENKDIPLNINFNIIFEQLLFYSLVESEAKTVACFYNETYNDNGYSSKEFADFLRGPAQNYMHLIGPHKRNLNVCVWLERHLYNEFPKEYIRIISLFNNKHYYYSTKIKELYNVDEKPYRRSFQYPKTVNYIKSLDSKKQTIKNSAIKKYVDQSDNFLLKEIFKYEAKLFRLVKKFNRIDGNNLRQQEALSIHSIDFFSLSSEKKNKKYIIRNDFLEIIHTCFDWTTFTVLSESIVQLRSAYKNNLVIGVLPQLFSQGYHEVLLDDVCVNIILLAEQAISFENLLIHFKKFFTPSHSNDNASFELLLLKMEFLVTNKILFIN